MTFIHYPKHTTHNPLKRAFTLAETLTTLVVIGIIASLTVPTVMKTLPNQNKIKFKKAYSTIENIISNMSNDATNYPSTLTGTDSTLQTVPLGFNNTNVTTNTSGCNKFTYFFLEQINTIGTTNCNPSALTVTKIGTTTDGIDWYIYLNALDATPALEFPLAPSTFTTKIIVDVNGSALPNCMSDLNWNTLKPTVAYTKCSATTTPDTFVIGVNYDGILQIGSSDTNDSGPTGAQSILKDPTNNK